MVVCKIRFNHTYNDIISVENLLPAWKEFASDKRKKKDVQEFSLMLMSNIMILHKELINKSYKHSMYKAFNINDPKPRSIHKAEVRDRLVHHALYRKLYPFFDRTFTSDSFSCRLKKGSHGATQRFKCFEYKVSENHRKTVWVLKCDVRKFFASINHSKLTEILKEYITDQDIIWLLEEIIESFFSTKNGVGLPLGNLTSQLFVNIYMNEFDQFLKHKLKVKYYIRYADDFVILSTSRQSLENLIPIIAEFLSSELKLTFNPDKVFIKTVASGVDFLGWVHFSNHRVLRKATKDKMLRRIKEKSEPTTTASYFGLLKHGNTKKLQKIISGTGAVAQNPFL